MREYMPTINFPALAVAMISFVVTLLGGWDYPTQALLVFQMVDLFTGIAAAFINGLAVLASVYRPPGWESWAWAVFAFGFLCALILGIYLAINILRPRRK